MQTYVLNIYISKTNDLVSIVNLYFCWLVCWNQSIVIVSYNLYLQVETIIMWEIKNINHFKHYFVTLKKYK